MLSVFDLLQASKKVSDPGKCDINVCLERNAKDKGKCRHCGHVVPWARARVISHKRANCQGISVAEKSFFHAQHALNVIPQGKRARQDTDSEARKQTRVLGQHSMTIDRLTVGERDAITKSLASMFFRTGIPFRVVESASMKALLTCLRPAYTPHIPTAKKLSGALLTSQYSDLWGMWQAFISEANFYTLVSDGWSNSRNEHQVNYVLIVPGPKPFFLRSESTVGIKQTSERIASEILKVIEELGASKCVAVVTDNAPNMRGAWDIMEDKLPLVFANGCAAHVMNLLIKDICSLPEFQDTLSEALEVIKFVRNHQHVLGAFREKKEIFQIKHDLVIVVPTRWYSHYNACRCLRAAKFAVQALLEEDIAAVLDDIQNQVPVTKFKELVGSPSFWSRLRKLTSVLKFPSQIIGKFEKHDCDLYKVYDFFVALQASWDKNLTLDAAITAKLKAIVTAGWNFIHSESMGFAYMLTPKSATKKWLPNDKVNTMNQLMSYICNFYDHDNVKNCLEELERFLSMYPIKSAAELNEYNRLSGVQYWAQYGMSEFPLLASVALRVFAVPTSSAAAERVWSIFSYLHTKRRNRMSMEKLDKLAFVYINHSLLDELDKCDYIKAYLEGENDDDDDDDVFDTCEVDEETKSAE